MIQAMGYEQSMRDGADARDRADSPEAERHFRAAVQADPAAAEPHHHLGALLETAGRIDEAEAAYREALRLAPGAAGTQRLLGRLLLSLGRYEEGFALFEARHALPQMAKPPLPFAEWRGEEVAGKRLLIWPEQGFGDQIQFARFAPMLKALGADVTLLCHPPLVRLFAGCLAVQAIGAAGGVEFDDPDYWVMTCSLAWRMGLGPEEVWRGPYLHPLQPVRGRGERVGMVTRGNPGNVNDANRSLGKADAEQLWSLAPDAIDLDPAATGARDFADTAAIIDRLDLVICVDTAVAHLAGAMGKPCWVLLPMTGTDWRWGREGRTTPWYPSLRLYRQQCAGDWSPVLDEIASDLRALS